MNTSNTPNTLHPSGPQCASYTEALPQFRQGTLPPADAASLSAHLPICAYCRARLAAYDNLDAALSRYANHFAPVAPSADDLVATAIGRAASPFPETFQKENTMDDADTATDTRSGTTQPLTDPSPPTVAERTPRHSRPHPALAVVAALLLVGLAATLFATISHPNNGPAHNGAATATTAQTVPTATTITRLPPTPLHLPARATLLGLSMTSPSDGWAGGITADMQHIILLRYHNGQWTTWQGTLPKAAVSLNAGGLSMASATDGWITTLGGFLHYTNNQWVAVRVPNVSNVETVKMISPTDGWAWASLLTANQNGFEGLLHYSDNVWSLVTLPVGLDTNRGSIHSYFSVTPTGECWLMYSDANSGVTKILRYTGGAFQTVSTLSHIQGESITMHSSRDGWLTGVDASGKAVYHFDGSGWTKTAIPISLQQQSSLYAVATSPAGAAWLTGGYGSNTGAAARYLNGAWELVKMPANITPFTFNLVTDDEGWALDASPFHAAIYHYQNGVWTQYPN